MNNHAKWRVVVFSSILAVLLFFGGYCVRGATVPEPKVKVVETTVYKFPNTPPFVAFSDPIDLAQALLLLNNMRASHEQVLNWTFTSNPGFGIADKEFQNLCIKEYNQLIDFVWRQDALIKQLEEKPAQGIEAIN